MAKVNVTPLLHPLPPRMAPPPFLSIGFRPFFSGAMLAAIALMAVWLAGFSLGHPLPAVAALGSLWHAHEMIYGYLLAVIAGFLLTAVRNWTGLATPSGAALAAVALPWLGARIAFTCAPESLAAPILDGLFMLAYGYAVAAPIVRVRQWRQLGILAKVVLLAAGNALYYAGQFGLLANGMRHGIDLGFYLVLGLVLTMARRLIPGFTERGTGAQVPMRNSDVVDRASMIGFVAFFVLTAFTPYAHAAGVAAAFCCVLHAWRLAGWWTPRILQRPLLWSLHLAYANIVVAFALHALAAFGLLPATLALHLFAVGGLALVTVSMMARVALGHTGRNVMAPSRAVGRVCGLLMGAVLARVFVPLAWPAVYTTAVLTAQVLWIAAFTLLAATCLPFLFGPRVDETA